MRVGVGDSEFFFLDLDECIGWMNDVGLVIIGLCVNEVVDK